MHRPTAAAAACLALLLAACGGAAPTPAGPTDAPSPASAAPTPAATPGSGETIPAPGSDSAIYPPNPGAIVVAIEAGHGGCLDWGVPDPRERGPEFAEKAITLAIARALADELAAEGITPLLVRAADEALAGDDYPPLGCDGAPFRDVNGDGVAGFGPDLPEATRTRDELQARLDVANLARADLLVSLHVDSITDAAGNLLAIARTETFYTDETPWGATASAELAAAIQDDLVAAMDAVAAYERQDRGTNAHNFYVVAPPLFEPTDERPDPLKQPTRGGLMPVVLVEVGSITLAAEHDLLVTPDGVAAAAAGVADGIGRWLAARPLAARIALADEAPGELPPLAGDEGPPRAAASAPPDGRVSLRLTNTGIEPWPSGTRLVAGAAAAEGPYLPAPPGELAPLDAEIPPLAPGESVVVDVDLPSTDGGSALVWVTLEAGGTTLAELGSPPLQLLVGGP